MASALLFLLADHLTHLSNFETVFPELVLEALILLVVILELTSQILFQVALLVQVDVETAIENVVQRSQGRSLRRQALQFLPLFLLPNYFYVFSSTRVLQLFQLV